MGSFRSQAAHGPAHQIPQQKVASLLAYLAYHRGHAQPRDVLLELLWPEADLPSGRNRLSTTLSLLRQFLDTPELPADSVLIADRVSVMLSAETTSTDVADFEAALRSAARAPEAIQRIRHLTEAVQLYRGELLPGIYDDWVFPERARLAGHYFHAVRRLVADLENLGDPDSALPYALDAVAADPLREEAHQDLIRLYVATGQTGAAVTQYRELTGLLARELRQSPSVETRALVKGLVRPTEQTAATPKPPPARVGDPAGGALPSDSPWYVERIIEQELHGAIGAAESTIVLKGAGQTGKSSLLARAVDQAREAGSRVALTSLQALGNAQLENPDRLLFSLAEWLADELDLPVRPPAVWDSTVAAGLNLWRYVERVVLAETDRRVVWGLDDVDLLFPRPHGSDVFGLFRSWHNERARSPGGPWKRLTLILACATEPHLYLRDLNQSPFNVGVRLELGDFSPEECQDLNRRYGSPVRPDELGRFRQLVGGHPYLVHRGLQELARRSCGLAALEQSVLRDGGAFADALRRIVLALRRDPELVQVLRRMWSAREAPDPESFYRLKSAGVLLGDSPADVRPRCRAYDAYLRRYLGETG